MGFVLRRMRKEEQQKKDIWSGQRGGGEAHWKEEKVH
jgi:hypothetical protein